MAGPNKFCPPCNCCECPQYLCVIVRSTCTRTDGSFTYTPVTGAAVTVKDSDETTIATGTTTGNGWCTYLIIAAGTYDVEVTKTGYDPSPATGSVTFSTCNQSKSLVLEMCPLTADISVHVGPCNMPGATVDISGDCTDSGTTDADGLVSFTLDKPAGQCYADITITVTPPACYGAASQASAIRVCFPHNLPGDRFWPWGSIVNFLLSPAAGHINVLLGGRYLPETLPYSDALGSCTLTWNQALFAYAGSYTFASNGTVGTKNCLDEV
jgi:hypothetical protein